MTEPTNTIMTSYATQILMDYAAYDDTVDEESLKENFFINAFNNRLDALYTQDFILTEDLLISIVIKINMDEAEYDLDEYNEYLSYEEYIWDFVMDNTSQDDDDDDDDDDYSAMTDKVDTSSVDALLLAAPTNEAAPAA